MYCCLYFPQVQVNPFCSHDDSIPGSHRGQTVSPKQVSLLPLLALSKHSLGLLWRGPGLGSWGQRAPGCWLWRSGSAERASSTPTQKSTGVERQAGAGRLRARGLNCSRERAKWQSTLDPEGFSAEPTGRMGAWDPAGPGLGSPQGGECQWTV